MNLRTRHGATPKDKKRQAAWLIEVLSKRELQILYCVARGVSTRDLAALLSVTEKTVKFHLTNIYHKLGVRNRVGLLVFLYENGLMEPLELLAAGPCAEARASL